MIEIKKIALVGSYGNGKTITSLALSEITNLPRAHVENIDILYKDIYGVSKNPKEYTRAELFSVGLARFHSRIRQEEKSGFISDGSVLNELAYGEARLKLSKNSHKSLKNILYGDMYNDFGKRLENAILDYAKQAYSKIYYLKINPLSGNLSETNIAFQNYFEESMLRFIERCNLELINLSGLPRDFLSKILNDNFPSETHDTDLGKILEQAAITKKNLRNDFHFGK